MSKINKNMKKMPKTQSIWLKISKITAWFLILTLVANILNMFVVPGHAHAAAPTYFGSASNPADNGTGADAATYAVTPPTSMVAGDLVVLVGAMQVASAGKITVSATGGQTWNGPYETAANDEVFSVFWSTYNGTWGANPSLAFASQSGTQPVMATMHVFRPASVGAGSWVISNAFNGGAEASASPVVVSGITTSKVDTVTLAGWAVPNISTWGTLSGAGWVAMNTAQYRNSSGSDQSVTFAHQLKSTTGATNDVSRVPSIAAAGISFTIAWSFQFSPTVALNTPTNGSTIYTDTPDLVSTCTDVNGDLVEYNVQVDTSVNFDSQSGAFSLKYVDLWIRKVNSPTDSLFLDVKTTSPSGTVLGTSDAVLYSSVSGTAGYVRFTFATPIAVSGAKYYMVLRRTAAYDSTNDYNWYYNATNAYSGGGSSQRSNGVWTTEAPNDDMRFIIYDTSTIARITQDTDDSFGGPIAGDSGTAEAESQSFTVSGIQPFLSKFSAVPDATFTDVTNGANTHPFPSGDQVKYTIQPVDALTPGQTYYWRVACLDPSGSNTYGTWSSPYSFIVDASVPTLGEILFLILIGCAVFIGVKSGVIKLKLTEPEPKDNKPPKDINPDLLDTNHQRSIDEIRTIPRKEL